MKPRICLLKRVLPNDPENGVDMRFIHLCPYLHEVFYVQCKSRGESGLDLTDDAIWPTTNLDTLDEIAHHLPRLAGCTWIAGDFDSFRVLKKCGVSPVIYDDCDSKSLYFERRYRMLPWKSFLKKVNSLYQVCRWSLREREVCRTSAGVVVPAIEDAKAFRRWKASDVRVISNGTSWVERPAIARADEARAMMFHGAFSWAVNVSTAEYLVQHLFPEVQQKRSDAELRIAGNPIPPSLEGCRTDQGIYLEGYVDDIREWLAQCGVYVMPMFQGGGIKNKLLEAMAAGLPIVTNSMGAEAMHSDARSCFLVADGLDELAQAVVSCFEDSQKAMDLGERARTYAVEHFCWSHLATEYHQFLCSKTEEGDVH